MIWWHSASFKRQASLSKQDDTLKRATDDDLMRPVPQLTHCQQLGSALLIYFSNRSTYLVTERELSRQRPACMRVMLHTNAVQFWPRFPLIDFLPILLASIVIRNNEVKFEQRIGLDASKSVASSPIYVKFCRHVVCTCLNLLSHPYCSHIGNHEASLELRSS